MNWHRPGAESPGSETPGDSGTSGALEHSQGSKKLTLDSGTTGGARKMAQNKPKKPKPCSKLSLNSVDD